MVVRRSSRIIVWCVAASIAALTLTACGDSATHDKKNVAAVRTAPPAQSAAVATTAARAAAAASGAGSAAPSGSAGAAVSGPSTGQDVAPITGGGAASLDRKSVRNADVGIEVDDPESAVGSITGIAGGLGGYVADSKLTRADDRLRGTLTVRVPADSFDRLMAQVEHLASRVLRENVSSQDVTEEYADLDARTRNLQATADQERALLETVREKTNRTEDILAVYRELSGIQGQIEQAKGRMQYLGKLSDLATVNVELIPKAALGSGTHPETRQSWSPVPALHDAAQVLEGAGQIAMDVLIWIGVFVLPLALAVSALAGMLVFATRRLLTLRRAP